MTGFITKRLARWAEGVMKSRPPDFIIGGDYLRRWWIIPRNRFLNVYLHEFRRSDDDRALHDHPWWNMSWLLKGRYLEHTIDAGGVHQKREFRAGAKKLRSAKYAHRVELLPDITTAPPEPCVSLFITGPRIRDWGFHCTNRWVPWQDFTDAKKGRPGEIGPGCGD